jgi:hypothetical protein
MKWVVRIGVAVAIFALFPHAFAFAEAAALSAMRLWWLVLLVILAVWLIWGYGRGY